MHGRPRRSSRDELELTVKVRELPFAQALVALVGAAAAGSHEQQHKGHHKSDGATGLP